MNGHVHCRVKTALWCSQSFQTNYCNADVIGWVVQKQHDKSVKSLRNRPGSTGAKTLFMNPKHSHTNTALYFLRADDMNKKSCFLVIQNVELTTLKILNAVCLVVSLCLLQLCLHFIWIDIWGLFLNSFKAQEVLCVITYSYACSPMCKIFHWACFTIRWRS